MQFKKTRIAAVIAAVMMITSVTASAEWIFAGYDTTNLDNIGKIYNEKVDGNYTCKTKIDPISPFDVEWVAEGYELAYPHAGYDRLYLEGNAQVITRYNNLFPQWETRLKDYTWELCGDHRIYQRQQTNIPGKGWTWDFSDDALVDKTLFTKTTRFADTVDSYKLMGFANLDLNGYKISKEVEEMYKYFNVFVDVKDMVANTMVDVDYDGVAEALFAPETLSMIDEATGRYIVSDALIAEYVASIQSKFVTGPSLEGGYITKDVAGEYLKNNGTKDWHWDLDTVRFGGANIGWTAYDYEIDDMYKHYQCLVINGVVCDGTKDTPRIYRYTGGKATPEIEWRYISWKNMNDMNITTANGPLDIVEWKHVDGKPAYNADGTPIIRIPTGEYANCYIYVTNTEIQLWRETGRGEDEIVAAVNRATHPLGQFDDAFVPGTVKYELSDVSAHIADFPATVGHCK